MCASVDYNNVIVLIFIMPGSRQIKSSLLASAAPSYPRLFVLLGVQVEQLFNLVEDAAEDLLNPFGLGVVGFPCNVSSNPMINVTKISVPGCVGSLVGKRCSFKPIGSAI